jgi:hypothetical protein
MKTFMVDGNQMYGSTTFGPACFFVEASNEDAAIKKAKELYRKQYLGFLEVTSVGEVFLRHPIKSLKG